MKTKILITLSALLFSTMGIACDYHGMNFGVFGKKPGNSQFNHAIRPPQLEVTHPASITVSSAEPQSIRVRYYQPNAYRNMQISIDASDNIKLSSSENVPLDKLFGAFDLSFETLAKGEHHIELAIKGLMNGRPYFKVHKMTVVSE